MCFTTLVPYIGIIIGSFTSSSSLSHKRFLLVCRRSNCYLWFIQFIEGNFITPKITGSKVSLNSFASILAIILFRCMGIPGMILVTYNSIIESTFDTQKFKPIGFVLGEADDKYFSNKAKNRLRI
jgi:hypothetical protein